MEIILDPQFRESGMLKHLIMYYSYVHNITNVKCFQEFIIYGGSPCSMAELLSMWLCGI